MILMHSYTILPTAALQTIVPTVTPRWRPPATPTRSSSRSAAPKISGPTTATSMSHSSCAPLNAPSYPLVTAPHRPPPPRPPPPRPADHLAPTPSLVRLPPTVSFRTRRPPLAETPPPSVDPPPIAISCQGR